MEKNSSFVQDFFNRWKNADEFHFVGTQAFFKLTDAKRQAKNIAANGGALPEVVTVTREEAFAGEVANALPPAPKGEASAPAVGVVINDSDSDVVKAAKQKVLDAVAAHVAAMTAESKLAKNTGVAKRQAAAENTALALTAVETAMAELGTLG